MDINLFMKYFVYFVDAAMVVLPIFGIIIEIVRKKFFNAFCGFCFLMFSIFMVSMTIFGGSAFLGNASLDYELYEEGHYYLCNHGNYTEVSYEVYTYMQIIEIVGNVFFAIAFITSMFKNKKETGSFFRYKKKEKQLLGSGWKNPFLKE